MSGSVRITHDGLFLVGTLSEPQNCPRSSDTLANESSKKEGNSVEVNNLGNEAKENVANALEMVQKRGDCPDDDFLPR